ncbi:ATP-binding protein [Pseudobdellovibrio sp. HCB154]|uniref:ATP-binding protein n=1 Tax=Pseudobdellovibrio sp. HCB154 TaxID=3386277 RepID=UPI00391744FC
MSKKKPLSLGKNYRSLRSILIIWFTLFSIIPLLFVGWYSVFKFEKAFDQEVSQRLQGNGREIESIISDYYRSVTTQKEQYAIDPRVAASLQMSDRGSLNNISIEWISRSPITALSFYDRDGRLITTSYRDDKNQIRHFELTAEKILLNEKYLQNLKDKADIGFVDEAKNKVSLILFSKVLNANGKHVGYFEQIIELKELFLSRIRSRLKIESFLVTDQKNMIAASRNEFRNIKLAGSKIADDKLVDYNLYGQNYGFILYPLSWDRSKFFIGLGTLKKDSQAILKNVNIAFVTVVSVVSVFLILTILITTNWFLKPVERLINGFKMFDRSEQLHQLPVNNKTEIGLLTEAFNEMSYKVFQARMDLRKKIKELEKTNSELVEAQTKLVHSAKMTSLGQLVAGVAHELNNPIGFIYSNMTHLKEYTDNLFSVIDSVKDQDENVRKKIADMDYDYVKSDLPRLIKSCQDGAQRTRDIVLGLRNFSRLEEAQLKEIDIHQSLDTTLEILQSEIKNRIVVHKQYEPIPKVLCFASQINQVIMNILANALQAIQGNGEIWITTIPLKAGPDQIGRVQISIQDSGSGMDAQTLEKIFEPFFTTKGVGQGTGLGLSISYGIIQNHGGEIQVRSQKGVGTEFVIIIPVSPPKNFKV